MHYVRIKVHLFRTRERTIWMRRRRRRDQHIDADKSFAAIRITHTHTVYLFHFGYIKFMYARAAPPPRYRAKRYVAHPLLYNGCVHRRPGTIHPHYMLVYLCTYITNRTQAFRRDDAANQLLQKWKLILINSFKLEHFWWRPKVFSAATRPLYIHNLLFTLYAFSIGKCVCGVNFE